MRAWPSLRCMILSATQFKTNCQLRVVSLFSSTHLHFWALGPMETAGFRALKGEGDSRKNRGCWRVIRVQDKKELETKVWGGRPVSACESLGVHFPVEMVRDVHQICSGVCERRVQCHSYGGWNLKGLYLGKWHDEICILEKQPGVEWSWVKFTGRGWDIIRRSIQWSQGGCGGPGDRTEPAVLVCGRWRR